MWLVKLFSEDQDPTGPWVQDGVKVQHPGAIPISIWIAATFLCIPQFRELSSVTWHWVVFFCICQQPWTLMDGTRSWNGRANDDRKFRRGIGFLECPSSRPRGPSIEGQIWHRPAASAAHLCWFTMLTYREHQCIASLLTWRKLQSLSHMKPNDEADMQRQRCRCYFGAIFLTSH